MIYIYCVVNTLNSKKYVGQTRYLPQKRFSGHCTDAVHRPERRGLARAINKYGKDSFVVEQLCATDCQTKANELERKLILFFDCLKSGYNMLAGGAGKRTIGNPHTKTPEWKAKMSEIRKSHWRNPEIKQRMLDGRWANKRRVEKYKPPVCSKEEQSAAIAKSNKSRAKVYKFLTPSGDTITSTGLPELCKQYNLNSTCMSRVANGHYKHHKGWKAA